MLPSTPLGTLPPSACTAGTSGSYGPDRISTTAYDFDSRLASQTIASGTSSQATYVTSTYSNNGRTKTALDGMLM